MSHPVACSHGLSPAPLARRPGSWSAIVVHLAAQPECCLCSDGERVQEDRSPVEGPCCSYCEPKSVKPESLFSGFVAE